MERRRNHMEISRDILEEARAGAGPTALVYGANLNFNIIKKYLQELVEAGLIRVDAVDGGGSRTRIYTTTDRGLIFMESLGRTLDIYRGELPGGHPPDLAPVS